MIGLIIAAAIVAFILLAIFLPIVALSLLAFIALIIVVILFIPIGVELSYIDDEFSLAAKLSAFSIKLFPKKQTQEEADPKKIKDKPKKKAGENSKKTKKKLELNFEEIIEIIKKALKGISKFGKLCVHNFLLHYIAAGKDPYSTAMTYNYVNAALSSLAPCCSKLVKVKGDVDVWTDVDFTREKMLLNTEFSVTLRLIQVMHVALVAGFGILVVLLKNRRRLAKENRNDKKNKKFSQDNNTKENKEKNIQTEERMDSNG